MKTSSNGSGSRKHGGAKKRKNTFVTKSGQTIKIKRSFGDRLKMRREDNARKRAERLIGMPKSRIKRVFFRLHPKRLYKYWFSRDGAIMALKIIGVAIIINFLLVVGVFAYFRKDLPNLKDVSGNNIGGSIRYYDKTGQTLLWEDYDGVKRIPVKEDEISQYVKDATVAIEDKDFFKHGGFDTKGIVRAGFNNVLGSGGTQGGSTITQQLVKLTQNWTKDRSYTRKVKELILSVEIERSYSKKEILTGYLNTAPYGSIDYGVEAATRDYFDKSAKDLTLDEAALLAAIPKSPSYYSPFNAAGYNKGALIGRQHYILDQMEQQGMITKEERDAAKKIDTLSKLKPRKPKYADIKAPWFVLTAKEQLEEKFGEQTVMRGGWKVTTTLDMKLQSLAETQVNKGIVQIKRQGGDVAGFVAEDVKTGQVVALVGGSDFSNPVYGQNNYARYRLPPGSSFKPYDYVSLIEHTNNFGAGSVLYDTQGPLDGYPCTNKNTPKNGGNCMWDYDLRYPGPLSLRYALGGSRNVPAVKAMLTAGIDKTIQTAEKLGLKSGYNCYADEALTVETQCYSSSAIGDGAFLKLDEHVHGYATISRNGNYIPQTYILKIENVANKTIYQWEAPKGEQVVRADSAYIVADMLSDPNASYFSAGRKPHRYKDWKFAMKTGTTNDAKDGWMMGFSTQYSAGVWVGYHNRQIAMSGGMENMTQPIWQGWMQGAHDGLKAEDRVKPASVQTLPAFVVRNHVGVGSVEPSPANDLFPGWYEVQKKKTGVTKTIDIVSNKLATECTPELAKKTVNDADAQTFSGDRYAQNQSTTTTTDKDDIHNCDDIKPGIRLIVEDLGGGRYRFSADVTPGTHPLSSAQFPGTVSFKVNGQTISGGAFNIDSAGTVGPVTYTADSGTKTVTVEIVDSVLYSASDSRDISGSGSATNPLTITSPADGISVSGGSVTVNWNDVGGGARYTLYVKKPSAADFSAVVGCSNQASTNCTIDLSTKGTYQMYVGQVSGDSSAVVSIVKK